jgi:hypothetical protein
VGIGRSLHWPSVGLLQIWSNIVLQLAHKDTIEFSSAFQMDKIKFEFAFLFYTPNSSWSDAIT